MRFKANVKRTFAEYADFEFEADDAEEAQETARDLLSVDCGDFNWSAQELEDESVESVEEIE